MISCVIISQPKPILSFKEGSAEQGLKTFLKSPSKSCTFFSIIIEKTVNCEPTPVNGYYFFKTAV